MTRYVVLVAIVLLSACAGQPKVVPYGPMTERGGYREEEVEPGVWRVFARTTGAGYASDMAEYRAAEMLKAQGFPYVQILKQFSHAEMTDDLGGGRREVIVEDHELTVRGAYDRAKPTDCRQTGALRCWTFTPETIMKDARKHLRFTKKSAFRPDKSESARKPKQLSKDETDAGRWRRPLLH